MLGAAQNSFLVVLGNIVYWSIFIYVWLIIIRVLLTWVNPNPYSPFMLFLSRLVDPVLNRGRRMVPLTLGGLDLSPIMVIILVQLIGTVLGQWLISLGYGASKSILAPLMVLGILSFINTIAWVLIIMLLARVVMSLVSPSPHNMLVLIVYGVTEPLVAPLRGLFPFGGPGGLDIKALIVLVALVLIQQLLIGGLYGLVGGWMGLLANVR